MKTRLLLLSALLSMVSCSVREDRIPCPGKLRLDLDLCARYSQQFSVKGWNSTGAIFGERINVGDWPDGWSVSVPKGAVEYTAYSAPENCAVKGNTVVIPEGQWFDRIWACHRTVMVEDEVTEDRVEPHKQWAGVTVKLKDFPEGKITAKATGSYAGFSLLDLSPVTGPFEAEAQNDGKNALTFNLPRQGGDDLKLDIYCDGQFFRSYKLGRMISDAGFDWKAEDLDDIYLAIEFQSAGFEIRIDKWYIGSTYSEVKSVSIIPESGDFSQVRSSFGWNDSDIRNLQILIWDEMGNETIYRFNNVSRSISFPGVVGRTYYMLAVANLDQELDNLQIQYFFYGYWTPPKNTIARNGIPMVGESSVTVTRGTDRVTLLMTRMLARIDFNINTSLLDAPDGFHVTSATVYDGADCSFDTACASDIATLENGGTISLYTYENLNGNLLPSNTDPWNKVPSSLGKAKADKCTYLEIRCSYDSGTKSSDDITYRMYIGRNTTTNFDVARNTVYRITLKPTEAEIYGARGSWKISSYGWTTFYTYSRRLAISNGGDLGAGDSATFTVRLFTDSYIGNTLYEQDSYGESIANSRLEWGFGLTPAASSSTSPYAAFTGKGEITGLAPGTCTVVCWLPDEPAVYATKTITIHQATPDITDLGIDLRVQWGEGNYYIGYDF